MKNELFIWIYPKAVTIDDSCLYDENILQEE